MSKALFGKLGVILLTVLLLSACSKTNALEIGDNAPEFTLKDMDGRPVNFADFKGKVIILDFFASWCPPCRKEIPDFIMLQNSYGKQGFAMVGIAVERAQDARAFAEKMGINYPILIDDNVVSGIYGPVRSIPTTYVIGRDSKIARVYIGHKPKDVFEKDIGELLK